MQFEQIVNYAAAPWGGKREPGTVCRPGPLLYGYQTMPRGKSGVGVSSYAAPSWSIVSKKGAAASSLRRNSRPKEPGPQLLEMAEDAFCR